MTRSERSARARGYLVHGYTAASLPFLVLGGQWVLEGRFRLALLAMAVTIFIDATDGALARRYRTKEVAAGIDGALLDNIVDFVGYVFLPLLFLLRADMLAGPGVWTASLIAVTSAFGFSRATAKQAAQGFFLGFPSYWNVVTFYLFLLGTPPWFNTTLLLLLAALVLVPVRFLYVSRLRAGRALHLVLGGLWGLVCLVALALEPGSLRSGLLLGSLAYVAVYTVHSLLLDLRSRRSGRS